MKFEKLAISIIANVSMVTYLVFINACTCRQLGSVDFCVWFASIFTLLFTVFANWNEDGYPPPVDDGSTHPVHIQNAAMIMQILVMSV